MTLDERPRFQDLSRSKVPPGFRGRSGLTVLVWQTVQQTLFAWSPQPAYGWRRWLLRLFGADVGKGVLVRPTVRVTYPWKVKLGDYCWIGDNAELYSLGPIGVGANSVVSQRCYICAATHDYTDITFPLVAKPVVIEREVWIAADCFIAPGVTVGVGAIVGARSTVLVDVLPANIVAGNPIKKIGDRLCPTS
ncbi:WcaF family extracellular polysaccharide biosynthesis acetyltransferase [Bradyrhizobium sp. 150]|uniref:WcaF family extracellular polysaccharide biosynthesis acetyltransferase n=1 Tax=Bradyrhizobium sp. 150 TaxID=2782625 RepID=UPI001FF8736C|nr:WcaF family extracellular polysaccharide biosynthesis acetyltransferase [Bradyrhizobium sp. 150]MCK1675315.1 colanic acid biosynthesis acetyltransferase WcaF [Bradyrhizobium sp. 150]